MNNAGHTEIRKHEQMKFNTLGKKSAEVNVKWTVPGSLLMKSCRCGGKQGDARE